MIRTLAIENYRSLEYVVTDLQQITVVTGPNGSGKTNLYRSLKLLQHIVSEGALTSLAAEGGLANVLHAGKSRAEPVALRLGFATDDWSYAIDIGLPQLSAFRVPGFAKVVDPEVKNETVWFGETLRRATILAERRSLAVHLRDKQGDLSLSPMRVRESESMLATLASPTETPELFELKESARAWRFYDQLRVDTEAPARRPGPVTFTPVLDDRGSNLPGALATVLGVGDGERLQESIAEAFDGSQVTFESLGGSLATVCLSQPGLNRNMQAAELSDGTLRFILLATALLSPRPPKLLVLNEPEASLHPSLLAPLAGLIRSAAKNTQVIVVSHAQELVSALEPEARVLRLEKPGGATLIEDQLPFEGPVWHWPRR
ncbi:AAA family ATPase [Leucobacter chinensis]|uniref:AAA family ATPase n=1 Tax=Leucobacter chinensis TaxID=2851010 RepID=UPI001C242C34|nr:AAA family ATPase [Leucobacter chinensis]